MMARTGGSAAPDHGMEPKTLGSLTPPSLAMV